MMNALISRITQKSIRQKTFGSMVKTEAGYLLPAKMVWALGKIPFVAYSFVLIAPYTSCQWIHEQKNVMGLSPAPFLSLITHSLMWTLYGLVVRDTPIYAVNMLGIIGGSYFTWTYHRYKSIDARNFALTVSMPIVAAACVAALSVKRAIFMVGLQANLVNIIFAASPLVQMKKVIDSKNSAIMPFQTSLALFFNYFAWTAYGSLVLGDIFVVFPALVGVVLACTQLALIAKYPPKHEVEKERKNYL